MSVDETENGSHVLTGAPHKGLSLVAAMIETGVGIPSMCLSVHRRFPFGSRDEAVRERAREIMSKAIRLARDLGIRTISWQVMTSITKTTTKAPGNVLLKGWRGQSNRRRHHK